MQIRKPAARAKLSLKSALFVLLAITLAAATAAAKDQAVRFPVLAGPGALGTVITGKAGVIRIKAKGPSTVCLAVVEGLKAENCILTYRAEVRTRNLKGKAFLEMWCHLPGKGDFFSRGIQTALSGDRDWATLRTPFYLKTREICTRVTLSLAVVGSGEVWVKNPSLTKKPRP